jgi:hypothetical protein
MLPVSPCVQLLHFRQHCDATHHQEVSPHEEHAFCAHFPNEHASFPSLIHLLHVSSALVLLAPNVDGGRLTP